MPKQKLIKAVIITITSFFVLLTVLKSFYFSNETGGTDLRCRIIAARLVTTSNSPYFYKWQPADGEYFLNPNDDTTRLVNGNVVTPAVLAVINPVSRLPYNYIRFIWTALEILAAGLIFFLLYKSLPGISTITICVAATGIFCSDVWLFHAERGQMYIFYALLFTIIFWLAKKSENSRAQLLAGILSGLFIFLRPFTGVLLLAYFIARKKKLVQGWFIGVAAGLLIFVLPFTAQWKDYANAMQEYMQEMRGLGKQAVTAVNYTKPQVVENMQNLTKAKGFNIQGLAALPEYLSANKINVTSLQCWLIFFVLAGISSVLFYRQNKNAGTNAVFVFAFLLYILAEISFLTPRGGYNVVQWLFIIPVLLNARQKNIPFIMVTAFALLLLHNFPFYFPYQCLIAEVIFIVLSFIFLLKPVKA